MRKIHMPPIQAHAQHVKPKRKKEGNIASAVLIRPMVRSHLSLHKNCMLMYMKLAPCAVKVRANRCRPTAHPSFKGRSFQRNNETAHSFYRSSPGSTDPDGEYNRIS